MCFSYVSYCTIYFQDSDLFHDPLYFLFLMIYTSIPFKIRQIFFDTMMYYT